MLLIQILLTWIVCSRIKAISSPGSIPESRIQEFICCKSIMLNCTLTTNMAPCHCALHLTHAGLSPVQGSLGYLLAASGDPNIQGLVEHLPQKVQDRKVDSESLGHVYQIAKWKQWADINPGMGVFPVKPSHFCQYLTHLIDSDGHEAAVADVSNAMTWVHDLAGYISPVTDPRVGALLGESYK